MPLKDPGQIRSQDLRVICVTIKQLESYNRGCTIVQPRLYDCLMVTQIVQPQLYDCLMVTQITLKTEGPHGFKLPSGRQTEVDPLYPGLIILTVYDCGNAFQSLERS
jgi:hypothetical protein